MGRTGFIVANEAARQSTAAAVAGNCTATDLRVLLAVHSLTVHWSQLTDRRSLGQVAEAAGLKVEEDRAKRHSNVERGVSRSLRRLAAVGAVVYEPSRGRGHLSLIGVPPTKGGSPDHLSGGEKVAESDTKGGQEATQKVAVRPPTQESYASNSYARGRRSRPASFGDGSAWADHPGGKVEL